MPCNSRWLAIITVVGTGVGMAIWTWGTWPDPITDFGKEVYIAWQLSQGKRLYVDVAYHLGVLSPYFNALIFKIFGASLASIEWVDLGLIAAIAVLLFRLIDRIAGLLAATVTGVVFFTLFAFGHFTPIADYNYVCPYDYEHTHGLLLGLVGLTAAGHYNRTGRLWAIVLAGAAVGLAFLTRAELFVAAGAGVGVSLIPSAEMPLTLALSRSTGRLSSPQAGRGDWGKIGGLFLAGILLPILSAWGLLAVALPAPIAWRGILGSWPVVFDRSVAGNRFYRESMGTLNAGESLWRMARWGCYWLLLVGVPLVGWGIKRNAYLWMALAFIWGAGVACVAGHFEDPAEAFSPLPLAVVGCLILAWKLGGPRRGVSMGVVVWGFVLLGKICLNARIYQYGFVLAMPATVIVVIGGISWLPELIGRRGGEGRYVASAFLGGMGMVIVAYLLLANHLMGFESHRVSSGDLGFDAAGKNQFWADSRGQMLNEMVQTLRQKAKRGETLAVMPEGAMLNFLAGMPNPTPYWSFNPPYSFFAPGEGEAAGEAKMLRALAAGPPDWIVLVKEDLSDFGTAFFGKDYGLEIYGFVRSHYQPELQLGSGRAGDNEFGMMLLRRSGYNGVEPKESERNDAVSSGR